MEKAKTKGFYNKSLERALQILSSFNTDQQSMTLSQLARVTEIPKPTTSRLCATLVEYNFLRLDEHTKQYSPGGKLFEIGGLVYRSFALNDIASSHLLILHKKVQQTVFLDVIEGDEIVHIDKKEDPSSPIRFGLRVGARRPLYYGAPNQVLMAQLPDNEIKRVLKKYGLPALTKRSITNKDLFIQRLKAIRTMEYFVEEGEIVEGMTVVSAPVRNHTGQVVAAIAVPFVSESVDSPERHEIVKETLKAAAAISESLGFITGQNAEKHLKNTETGIRRGVYKTKTVD